MNATCHHRAKYAKVEGPPRSFNHFDDNDRKFMSPTSPTAATLLSEGRGGRGREGCSGRGVLHVRG